MVEQAFLYKHPKKRQINNQHLVPATSLPETQSARFQTASTRNIFQTTELSRIHHSKELH